MLKEDITNLEKELLRVQRQLNEFLAAHPGSTTMLPLEI
jgi:hypothetical protein